MFRIEQGEHTIAIKTASGLMESMHDISDETKMGTRRGRKWWCVISRMDGEKLEVLLEPKARCQRLLDIAPDSDE